jgi:hypothetical protein
MSARSLSSMEFYSCVTNTCTLISPERLSLPLTYRITNSLHLIDSSSNIITNSHDENGLILVMINAYSKVPSAANWKQALMQMKASKATVNYYAPTRIGVTSLSDSSSTTTEVEFNDTYRRAGYMVDISRFASIDELINDHHNTHGRSSDDTEHSSATAIATTTTTAPASSALQWIVLPALPQQTEDEKGFEGFNLKCVTIPSHY